MVRKLAEATGSISISMRGEKGESGDTPYVTKTVVDYAITSSVSEAKKWSSTAPDASAASNKGKFLWTRTTYTWSNNKTTENITYTYIGKDGATGATGNGVKSTEVTYQIWNSGTTKPTGTWSTSIPNITDANPYLWTRTIFVYTNGTRSDPSFSVATRGTKGALMREHDGFESGKYKYLSGSGAEEYIDVVCVKGEWYQCTKTYDNATSSPNLNDGHWTKMSQYKSIATHLLLAENATINMLGTNQINLFNPTTNGKMYGSFRVVSDDSYWSLWLGGETGDSASFAVKRNGYLKATNADISGRIDATSGSIGGFEIGNYSIGSVGKTEGMGLTNECLKFMNQAYLHGEGYFITCGSYMETGLQIFSTTSPSNNLSTGILIHIDAGTSMPSDPISGGKMCTALDLLTRWADQAGSFDMTNPYEGNHAIVIRGGDVIGLRPSFVRLAANYQTLTEYHHTVECYNTSAITIYLPSSPKYGQCYTIIQRGSRVTFSSGKGIYDVRRASSATTWYSDTRGQVSWLWYNGSQWIVCYTTN